MLTDADMEMASLQATAYEESRLADAGICCHGSLQGPPGNGRADGLHVCCLCGQVASLEDLLDERDERLIDA